MAEEIRVHTPIAKHSPVNSMVLSAQRKVRAMVLSGAIAIAVPSNHGKLVDITLWSLESVEALQARLEKLRVSASAGVAGAVRAISIGAATLQGGAVHMLHNLSISAADARELAKDTLQGMRKPLSSLGPGKFDLLLSLGSLWFQQDSLRKSYEALADASGSEKPEALAAVWSSSLGVMGMGVEVAGLTTQVLRPDLTTLIQMRGQVQTVALGARVAQYGGALVAITGVLDATQYAWAARRAYSQADSWSVINYRLASIISLASTGFGTIGALAPQSVLLGPVGIAVLLGLSAYAIASLAKKQESTLLEMWARRSCWGLPEKSRRWLSSDNLDVATGELNAAIIGMTADIDLKTQYLHETTTAPESATPNVLRDPNSLAAGDFLNYGMVLPQHELELSHYEWTIQIFRSTQDEAQIVSSEFHATETSLKKYKKKLDYDPSTLPPNVRKNMKTGELYINGSIALLWNHSIHAMTLEITYWPDKNDKIGFARLTVKHDKVDKLSQEKND